MSSDGRPHQTNRQKAKKEPNRKRVDVLAGGAKPETKGQEVSPQHPICFQLDGRRRFFVADFYCHEKRLVVEIDGKIHTLRANLINLLGMQVIRFSDDEIVLNLEAVLERVVVHL